ncbi:MAG: helix-turn-helix transcriptional regulator [Ilumatobacteraceae bacterium]
MARSNVGPLVRHWRAQRSRSQLDLAMSVGVSPRHLSFVETGRSRPSPELIEAIGIHLDVPLRERNAMLLAAGHAPKYRQTSLDDPAMAPVAASLRRILAAHEPYPGFVLDRQWNVVLANATGQGWAALLPGPLTRPSMNVFRVGLHPDGFARFTVNFDAWAAYLLGQLDRIATLTADPEVASLRDEVRAYPNVAELLDRATWNTSRDLPQLLVPCELDIGGTRISMFTTLTSFGTPMDITLDELAVELFFPSDDASATFFGATPS